MEKFNELLEELKNLNILQKSIDWAEDIPEEIWNKHFKGNFGQLQSGLDVDTHRWYEVSTTVIEIYDGILGISHISNLFSEISSCEDVFRNLQFFEMKEITITSYSRI